MIVYEQDGIKYTMFPEFNLHACDGCAFSTYDEEGEHDCQNRREVSRSAVEDKLCFQESAIYCKSEEEYVTAKVTWRLEGNTDEN